MSQALAEKSWTVALRAPAADEIELVIYDAIGEAQSFFDADGVTAKDVLAALRGAPNAKRISIRVNSNGGVVDDAKAMINLLAERKSAGVKVEATVDGMAASSASYLLTVAQKVTMPSNAFLMLHQTRGGMRGNADEFATMADFLRKTNAQLAEAYAAASARRGVNKTAADYLAAFAKGDLYLTADEAIAWGLADEKSDPIKAAATRASFDTLDAAPDALKVAPYVVLATLDTPPAQAEPSAVEADPATPPAPAAEPVPEPPTDPTTPAREGSAAEPQALAEEPQMTDKNTSFPTTIAIALGLAAGSTESDIQAALGRLRDFERDVLAISGVGVSSEAIGTLRGYKAKAEAHDKMALELASVKGERDKQNFETLIANGKTEGKLVAVTAKHYEEKFAAAVANGRGTEFVDELRGFLSVAPRVLPQAARQVTTSASSSNTWNGKSYAELTNMEKHQLSKEDPELFAHMRRSVA